MAQNQFLDTPNRRLSEESLQHLKVDAFILDRKQQVSLPSIPHHNPA